MYNCWNEALEYMIGRYGEQSVPLSKFNSKMTRTYKNNNLDSDGVTINLLMGQYYYGIEAQRELYYKLQSLGAFKQVQA